MKGSQSPVWLGPFPSQARHGGSPAWRVSDLSCFEPPINSGLAPINSGLERTGPQSTEWMAAGIKETHVVMDVVMDVVISGDENLF